MAVKATKKKLFQVARELNLGNDTIRDFLEKKGIPVSNINMRLSPDVYEMLLDRFSREKKEADKIQKRREERNREEQEIYDKKHAEVETPEAVVEEVLETTPEPEPLDSETVIEEETEVLAADDTEVEDEIAEEVVSEESQLEEEPVEVSVELEDFTVGLEEVLEEEVETVDETEEAPEVEAETVDEVVAEDEEEDIEEKPQVGDIIDHPMAKKFLERQKRLEVEKKERKKIAAERLKKAKEEKANRKKARPADDEASTSAEVVSSTPETTEEKENRRKKKQKKERDEKNDKESRRRKALEMLRKDRRNIRPNTVVPDEDAVKPSTGKRRKKKKKNEVDQQEVDSALKKTLAEMSDSGGSRKKRKKVKTETGEEIEVPSVIKVTEFITTQDLANLLEEPISEIIRKCLELGLMVTINQRLDMDTIKLLSEEFGYEVEEEEEFGSDFLEDIADEEDKPEDLHPRAPIVTIMGHVDHGKTSLLDYIRETNVVGGESGGITQHIGAYEVFPDEDKSRKVTFLDTPGHEAFTAMRARGAQVTDIVILVIAADDRVMPQTEEALDHAKAAGVSIVIAINKIDKPAANPEAIRKQLADRDILVEDWGGQYGCVEVSAKTGAGVKDLLDRIVLEAELLELKANPEKRAKGVVLEAQLDKGKGPVATVLIEEGTLRVGETFVIGQHWGKIRAMINDKGRRVKVAPPTTPVQILGIDGMPEAGDRFIVLEDERQARDIAQRRKQLKREQDFRQVRLLTLDELSKQIKTGDVKELKLLVKADVDGSAQALTDSLQKLSTSDVEVMVIRRAVGPITESDVILAAASEAIIIGFHVRPTATAKMLADRESVDIRQYKVIYDAIEDVEKALEGMLEPIAREVVLGQAEIRETFKISRIGTIAGCYITSGKITRNSKIRLVRNDVEIFDGKLASLKRFKDDVREVQSGYECGLNLEGYNDIKEGDIVEAYEIVMEAQTLR